MTSRYAADAVARVRQVEGQRSVVGQQQKPFGIEIEAPDRVKPDAELRDEIEHARSSARVLASGEEASGLVEEHVPLRLGAREGPPIHLDSIAIGVGAAAYNPIPNRYV